MKPMISVILIIAAGIASEGSETWNSVHEWGVVVFEEASIQKCGGAWKDTGLYPDYVPAEMEAYAPVVWIHGDPFVDAVFAVSTGDQRITFTYPIPDRTDPGMVEWDISTGHDTLQSNFYEGPFGWAIDYWRNVQSIPLFQESSGITEGFLYYECTVSYEFTDNFFRWSQSGNPVFTGDEIKDALFFTPYGVIPVTIHQDEFIPTDFPLGGEINPQMAPDTFHSWADSLLEPSEIIALWETWKPVFSEESTYWLVFPIPEEYYNEISTIRLDFQEERNVEYERFFLGAVKLKIQE
ncbi:MAG: hypothetical protein KAS73_02795 [Candidatus Sabulitectum sp.]|nr:hypothetical protein [Candidatus Sabulitectum sp.]